MKQFMFPFGKWKFYLNDNPITEDGGEEIMMVKYTAELIDGDLTITKCDTEHDDIVDAVESGKPVFAWLYIEDNAMYGFIAVYVYDDAITFIRTNLNIDNGAVVEIEGEIITDGIDNNERVITYNSGYTPLSYIG